MPWNGSAVCGLAQFNAHLLWQIPVGILSCILSVALLLFLFLVVACLFVDQKKKQEHDSPFFRRMMYFYIGVLVKVLRVHVHTKGLEQTPRDGRFVLVCNHISDADPILLTYFFRKSQLAFITKQ